MADTSDLKHMVMSFRVSELQVLLGFAGRNKSGRKHELMQRALQLVEKGCSTAIHIKIRDLYRRRFPPKAGAPNSKPSTQGLAAPGASALGSPSKSFSPYSSSAPYGSEYSPDLKMRRSGSGSSSSTSTSAAVGGPLDFSSKHTSGLSSPSSSPHNQVPVHPDVCFKRLPFYDTMGELLKPSSLVPRSQSRFQETFFIFHLTPQQAQDIAMSRDTQMGGRVEYTVQIQLRFCLLETSCEQEDNYPPSICVRVNGKMAPLPNPIPTNKPGVEPKRPSRPVNITTICRISPTVPNHINISWASEFGRSYCVAVYLVRRLSSDILLQRLKHNGIKHPDHTRALIKEKLAHDPESEIVTSSLRISLTCPLGKMRMSIPSRASTCNHLQCFDAPMFLQMNEKKSTWVCPVCDKSAEFEKLFIDGLFTEILRKESDCNEIKFVEDGSWHPMRDKEEEIMPMSPTMVTSIEDSPNPKKSAKSEPTEPSCSSGGGGGDVIDLTETDDEEDVLPVAMSVPDSSSSSSSSLGSPASNTSISPHANRSLSVISTPNSTIADGPKIITGCVSPPVISLDTPPRISLSPGSLPRSPRASNPRFSPYSTPLVSPVNLSPLGGAAGSSSLHTTTPPPPAHSHPPSSSSYNLLSSLGLPPPNPYYSSLFGNQLEPISDTDLDDFFSSFTSNMSGAYRAPPLFNPYGASMLQSLHHSLSDNSSDSGRSRGPPSCVPISSRSSSLTLGNGSPSNSPDSLRSSGSHRSLRSHHSTQSHHSGVS